MIKTYYRPKTIQEAISLLSNPDQPAIPLGGGTLVSRSKDLDVSVVDLQDLELGHISVVGNTATVGGTATLHAINMSGVLPEALRETAALEANYNIRQKATLAGLIVSGNGRSALLTTLLATDAVIHWLPGLVEQSLGEFLLTRTDQWKGKLIEGVTIPLNAKLKFASIARTPADQPVMCVSAAGWPSGRVRIALGGFGKAPVMALDAHDRGGAEIVVRDALTSSGDAWASSEYRQESAAILVKRLLQEL